jgi:NAD(P)-dependent dehydrogenase (short-subunit alcohol dehydrogenase family)
MDASILLHDKVILIAGGTGQIGSVIAMKAAQAGAKVIVPYRRRSRADDLMKTAGPVGGQFLLIESESNTVAAMQKVVEAGRQRFGRLDGFVNAAGGYAAGRVDETDEALWHAQMQVNLHQAFYGARAVLPVMRQQNSGRIVFIASIAAQRHPAGAAAYVVSKSALVTLAKVIAVENQQYHILTQVIAPGTVNTAANRQAVVGDPSKLVQPEEIASLVVHFLSDQVQHSTGSVIEIPDFV